MRENYSNFDFATEDAVIFNELDAISKEIDRCRERNLIDILTA